MLAGNYPQRLARIRILVSRVPLRGSRARVPQPGHVRIRIQHATHTTLITLAILQDDFTRLDRRGLMSRDVSDIEPAGGWKVRARFY